MLDRVNPFRLLRRPGMAEAKPAADPVWDRSTAPDAPMTLFMRIQTENGPRTVVASDITLAAASQISEALVLAGHYAQFVDQCSTAGTVAERVRRKMEALPSDEPARASRRFEIVGYHAPRAARG